MEFLDNATPKQELDTIYSLVLARISTNKAEIVEVNGYVAKYSNDEAANISTMFDLHLFHKGFKNTCNNMVIN